MSDAKAARIERLITLRSRAVDIAQSSLAAAARATGLARQAQEHAEQAWLAEVALHASASETTMADFTESRLMILALRQRADALVLHVQEAQAKEDQQREVLTDARRELRKLELWRDSIVESSRQESARRERVATDEIAARISRSPR